MPLDSSKKLSILYILEVLKEYSNETHPLKQEDILNKIYNIYGMECERKSIGANIDLLIDLGYDIIKLKKGCYLGQREIEPSEVTFLIDAIFSSKSIDGEHAKKLSKKLMGLLSKHDRKNYNYIYNSNHVTRTDNKQVFYNIEIIHSAIEQNKKISFNYQRFYFDKQKREQRKSKRLYVSPYFFVNNQGKYYLVCAFNNTEDVANYRVDNMKEVQIVDDERRDIKQLKNFTKGLDMAAYASKNQYMLSADPIVAKVKISNDYAENYVSDWFGDNARFEMENEEIFAYISSTESTIIYWCLQYGENIELIEPVATREKIKNIIKGMSEKYDR
ncbi:MAG: WYL domain-containing protein [Clostridia bacterium]|nr:WYL domain-containing protein [Clostridia bacterium]